MNKLRITVKTAKIAEETSTEDIEVWNKTVESIMQKADVMVENLEQWLEEQDAMKEKVQLDEKAERERVQRKKQLQFELKSHESKVKLQSEILLEVIASISAVK